jgi:hypothetical protein
MRRRELLKSRGKNIFAPPKQIKLLRYEKILLQK